MKCLNACLLAWVILLCGCSGKPYGAFFVESGFGKNEIELEPGLEKPFEMPQTGSAPIQELMLRMPLFHPGKYQFVYQSLVGEEQSLSAQFLTTRDSETYRVVFSEPLPQGGALAMINEQLHQPRAIFVGDMRTSVQSIAAREDLPAQTRLALVNEYNAAHWDTRLTAETAKLEGVIESQFFEQVTALASNEERIEGFTQYLAKYPMGAHIDKAVAALERLNLEKEDRVLALALREQASPTKAAALYDLASMVSGWNRNGAREALYEAMTELDDRDFEAASNASGWDKKHGLERYLANFPNGANVQPARTMLDEINDELEKPSFQNALKQHSAMRRLKKLEEHQKAFPDGQLNAQVEEQIAAQKDFMDKDQWEAAIQQQGENRKIALEAYIQSWPKGIYAARAPIELEKVLARLDDESYSQAADINDDYPRTKALERYLEDYPQGRHYQEARLQVVQAHGIIEKQIFEKARDIDARFERRKALQRYLIVYPDGAFRLEAETLLKDLAGGEYPSPEKR